MDQINNKHRTNKIPIFILISLIFFGLGFGVGNLYKQSFFNSNSQKINIENKESNEVNVDFNIFWEVWNRVTSNFYQPDKINPQQMIYGAIKGMVASLGDPYTVFLDPTEFSDLQKSMASEYEGIGVEMGFKNNQIVVITPFPNSPAIQAGVKAGDYIIKIGDELTTGMDLSEAAMKIRGEKGTSVKLTFLHEGEEKPYELEITRALINYDTVSVEMTGDTAYIRILQFGDKTNQEWDQVVTKIQENKNVNKVILDLRNNPGGYVESATYLAGDFVGREVVVKQRFNDGSIKTEKSSNGKKRLSFYKTVILINEGSASASEILTGALQYYKKFTIIGKKSFGKGIVQDQIPLSEETALHVTTSEWLTPDDKNIHGEGIDPDIEIEMTIEQIKKGEDPQLEKAKELLK